MGDVSGVPVKSKSVELGICVCGIMSTLVLYGIMQERIMRVPYGENKEFFKHSLFLVFCNRLLTSSVATVTMLLQKRPMAPVAPFYKYGAVSVSNILSTNCQYEALKYVSFPVQTLAKSAKMIPVMIWGTIIMQKRYRTREYLLALSVTAGCAVFLLYGDLPKFQTGHINDSSLWGVFLMAGYLGFDGFTSTFQDKLFKGYNMEILNQVLYVTLWSCLLSTIGLFLQGHWFAATYFVFRHKDCFTHIVFLSLAATASQFFISYTIRTFGALVFAIIMTTRQLISILLSCLWFGHSLHWQQWLGALVVFGALYYKSYTGSQEKKSEGVERLRQISKEVEHLPKSHVEEGMQEHPFLQAAK